jgi:hypothetical protein
MPDELPIRADVALDEPLRSYWLARLRHHVTDSYMGVALSKFPEDLRVYEHLPRASRADTVIEVGAQFGGSALWFRDRLASLARNSGVKRPMVVSIDMDITEARARVAEADPGAERSGEIAFVQADVRDPELADRVAEVLPDRARCLVSEDSAHVLRKRPTPRWSLSRVSCPGAGSSWSRTGSSISTSYAPSELATRRPAGGSRLAQDALGRRF